jgi:lipid-binding SYLF domain-containing protein
MTTIRRIVACVAIVTTAVSLTGCATGPAGDSFAEQRTTILKMRDDTLAEMYAKMPITRDKITHSRGYAVFSNVNINLLLLSSGNGYGIARNSKTGKDTYMKMRMFGVGWGAGVKDFKAVMIFKTDDALRKFSEEGVEWGAHADAAAVSGDQGMEKGLSQELTGEVEIYTFTETGVALQATVAGTKYWKDLDLN